MTNDFAIQWQRLVFKLSNRVHREFPFFELDDLIQEGYYGLLIAERDFKPELGFKFISFAYPIIMHKLRRYVFRQLDYWPVTRCGSGTKDEGQRATAVELQDDIKLLLVHKPIAYSRALAKALLEMLPINKATVLILHIIYGCSQRQIAAYLSVTPERARQIIAEATREARCRSDGQRTGFSSWCVRTRK
jgi:RNA polymerase sigma factor (sigma-70 family)